MKPTFRKLEIVKKGWGEERIIANDAYCGKLLVYDRAGAKSSGHYHCIKSETFLIVSGVFDISFLRSRQPDWPEWTEPKRCEAGTVIDIPAYCAHQVTCISDGGIIVECSLHHCDTDVVRLVPGDSQKVVDVNAAV